MVIRSATASVTGLLQFVDSLLQLGDSLMSINAVGNILRGVAQYFLDGQLIGSLVIQPRCAGVPALMGFMLTPRGGHHFFEQLQKSVVCNQLAIQCYQRAARLRHPVFIIGKHLPADRDKPVFTGSGFGVPDPEDAGVQFHILFQHRQEL